MFLIQGGGYFQTDLKWLAHKIWMLKSDFKLVVQKFVRCFIAVQNFKKFGLGSKPFKTSCEFIFFQIRIDFLKKSSNFN